MQLHHSACRSARFTSKARLLKPSDVILVPCVLMTSFFSIFYIENSWCFHIIPIFLRKRINHFFLGSLFVTLCKVTYLPHIIFLNLHFGFSKIYIYTFFLKGTIFLSPCKCVVMKIITTSTVGTLALICDKLPAVLPTVFFFFLHFIYFQREGKGERKRGRETST